jgi:ATP-dependent 26S proteasome regulatory subunit
MPDRNDLELLINARHGCITIGTADEEYVLGIFREIAVSTGRDLWMWTVTGGLRDALLAGANPVPDTNHVAAALVYLIEQIAPGPLCVLLDLPGHLKDETVLRTFREAVAHCEKTGGTLALVHTPVELPPAVAAVATEFDVSFPDREELAALLKETARQIATGKPIHVRISKHGMDALVRNLQGLTRRQARRVITDCICDDCTLDEADVTNVLTGKKKALHGSGMLQFVDAPVSLNDVGGLDQLKTWVLNRRPGLESAEAEKFGLTPPKGVLLLGVQGAGKSLAAKAVATASQLPLLRMDVGSLYDSYVGQSEKKLRESLRQAERMSPVVLWIDEIEKAFASAGAASSDGGLSRRMFGSLLTWMQERTAPVFLIATANDIESLPAELLRKGRFDEIFFVDLPGDKARSQIVVIHLQKRKRDPASFDLPTIVAATAGFSGAEIEQAIASALFEAYAGKSELTTAHIVKAAKSSPPLSVTMAERVNALRAWAADRCVPAD